VNAADDPYSFMHPSSRSAPTRHRMLLTINCSRKTLPGNLVHSCKKKNQIWEPSGHDVVNI